MLVRCFIIPDVYKGYVNGYKVFVNSPTHASAIYKKSNLFLFIFISLGSKSKQTA